MRKAAFWLLPAMIWSACAAAQTYSGKDINYLAHLDETNKNYYNQRVMGVARFSDIGTFEGIGFNSQAKVDVGFGSAVSCFLNETSVRRGDKVRISGSVGGAATAESWNEGRPLWEQFRPNEPFPKGRDEVMLLTGTCRIEKAN